MLIYILAFTFLASIVSLLLVGLLLIKREFINKFSFSLVSFAAGALLATAFLETLKEAVDIAGEKAFLWTTLSIAFFFILDRLFLFLHHDHENEEEKLRLPAGLLLFGDALHNFIDGTSIAASFLASIPLGVVTSITVFVHEIPHELGDFGILIHKGWERKRVLGFNIITGCTAIVGALFAFYLEKGFKDLVPLLLSITTGNFIYLSATNLLPEIHHNAKKSLAVKDTTFFICGIIFVALLIFWLE